MENYNTGFERVDRGYSFRDTDEETMPFWSYRSWISIGGNRFMLG